MELLISPFLDGELTPVETRLVSSHLSACADCSFEYKSMRQVSVALRQGSELTLPAPAGFKNALMQRINNEETLVLPSRYHNWLRRSWKQAAASAAAALLLMWGALSINPGSVLQIADNPLVVTQPANGISPVIDTDNNGNADPTGTTNLTGTPTPTGAQNDNPNPAPTSVAATTPAHSTPVFLNKERFITTTLLQVKVKDAAAALKQVVNKAEMVKAQTLNLGQQVNTSGSYTILKITVAKTAAPALISQLGSLGTVSGSEVDKKDITNQYADTLSQYQILVTQRATLQDDSQKAVLDQRIDALAADLQDWEQQADQETIVLWLEK